MKDWVDWLLFFFICALSFLAGAGLRAIVDPVETDLRLSKSEMSFILEEHHICLTEAEKAGEDKSYCEKCVFDVYGEHFK